MKPKNNLITVIIIMVVAFVLYEMLAIFMAGERALANIVLAPFNALKSAGKAIGDLVYDPEAPLPVTGDDLSNTLLDVGVTNNADPITQAQVDAYRKALADGTVTAPSAVQYWNPLTW